MSSAFLLQSIYLETWKCVTGTHGEGRTWWLQSEDNPLMPASWHAAQILQVWPAGLKERKHSEGCLSLSLLHLSRTHILPGSHRPSRGQPCPHKPQNTFLSPFLHPHTSEQRHVGPTSGQICGLGNPRLQQWLWYCSACTQLTVCWPALC